MTTINKPVYRKSLGTVFDGGVDREVIIGLERPNLVSVRLKGTRRTYHTTVEAVFSMALKADLAAGAREKRPVQRTGGRRRK